MDHEIVRTADAAPNDEPGKSRIPAPESQRLGASAYIYPALDPSHIRILVLEPASNNDAPLHISFLSASLPDLRGSYEAVSYTCGEPTLAFPHRHGDGSQVPVTANLELALRRLRHRLDKRWLWADALCIDQGNPQEKATQIPMMDKIYRGASRVLAWLGPGGDDAEKGMVLLGRLSQRPKHLGAPTSVDTPEAVRAYSLVHSFFDVPWFRRFWTVQACILNVDVVFVCGPQLITLARLIAGLRLFTSDTNFTSACEPPGLRAFAKTVDLWKSYSILDEQPLCPDDLNAIPKFDVLNLVDSFVENNCGDDRDRIYAVYGMASNIAPTTMKALQKPARGDDAQSNGFEDHVHMDIDYSLSVRDTIMSFALACIDKGMIARILDTASVRQKPLPCGNWPSWVPDWRLQPRSSFRSFKSPLKGANPSISFEGERCVNTIGLRVTVFDGMNSSKKQHVDRLLKVTTRGRIKTGSSVAGYTRSSVDLCSEIHQARLEVPPGCAI